MDNREKALSEQLTGLNLSPETVALQGKTHGLTPMQTMRLVLQVCGAAFNDAKEATTQVFYGLSREEYQAPLLADLDAAVQQMIEESELHLEE